VAAAVLVLGPAAAVSGFGGTAAHAAVEPGTQPDTVSAAAAAARSGVPVEDLSRRTERERTFANPDGTWSTEQSAVPERVRRADGSWAAVDLTLRRTGSHVAPAVAPYDVRLSAGGSGPFAVVAAGGGRLSMLPPWPLPEPELSGPKARYVDVLPGVDLVVTALPDGFSEVFVVRDRKAAANPALRTLRFGFRADALTVRADGGGFAVVDAAGTPVLASPTPMMWDSAGGSARDVGAPLGADRRARMALTVGAADLTVVPDEAMLTDPATVFPVYLDPVVSGARNEWIMISSGFPTQEYHKWGGTEGVGLCDVQTDGDCVRDQVKRLSWEFGLPASVRGSHVLNAKFSAYETHAYNCTERAVQLWLVGAISASSNWNNHSDDWSRQLDSVSVARSSGCSPGPGFVEFNATAGAVTAAASGWTTLTLGLKAGNETSMAHWKQFRSDARLSITYNTPPRVPTNLSTDGAGCATGTARPVISTATPTLRAVVFDVDPGETDLQAAFAWERYDRSVTPAVWRALGSGTHTRLAPGATGRIQITSGLVHGGIYRWHVRALDPWSHEGSTGTDPSDFSGWCEFEVDTQGPALMPGVSSPVYGTDLDRVYGAVGRTADFTFTASGVTDVTSYRWGWADPPTTTVAAPTLGAAVTIPLTPPPPAAADPTAGGLLALYVVSVDRSGRTSPMAVYPFTIGSATGPVGEWRMGEAAGATTFADSSGGARHATVTGAQAGVAGRLRGGPTAAAFDGIDDTATATGVPVDNTYSFSVSVWLAPSTSASGSRDALGFYGTRSTSFFVRQNPDGRWVLYAVAVDGDNPTRRSIVGTTATQRGVWTHVVAVHDAAAKELRLYVNGVLEATMAQPVMFRATAGIRFGGTTWDGGLQFPWKGAMAEARIYDRVLSPGELAPMAATLVGRWALDGDGSDAAPFNRPVTGPDTIMWTEDRTGLPLSAVSLNGTDEAVTTAGPVLRTTESFTVAAWVRTNRLDNTRTALSQRGVEQAAFFLGQRQFTVNGTTQLRWSFTLPSIDDDAGVEWVNASLSADPLTADDLEVWTHLAGVYDAAAGQVRLYVDGQLAATQPWQHRWAAELSLQVGRGWWSPVGGAPQPSSPWSGDIDDVQVFQGVLAEPGIRKVAGL
jgi:hypothetical protein